MPFDPALATWLNYALTFPLVAALLIMLIVIFPTDRPESNAGWRVTGSRSVARRWSSSARWRAQGGSPSSRRTRTP
jgi:hypothetical protein